MIGNIKEWYTSKFPDDEAAAKINPDLTFAELYDDLPHLYKRIGVVDYEMKERLFHYLADKKNCDYNDIYWKWLGHKY